MPQAMTFPGLGSRAGGVIGMVILLSALTLPAGRVTSSRTPLRVEFIPHVPRQGGFVEIVVQTPRGTPVTSLGGALADQPLHFETSDSVEWRALGGIPISAGATLPLLLTSSAGDPAVVQVDTVQVPIRAIAFEVERLRVDPKYATPPDSALAARIAREYRRAMGISTASLRRARLWSGPWQRPRPSRVTSGYGKGREFNGEIQSRHLGVDLSGATGAPVVAPNRGIVALVDETYYGGNVVYLDHGRGVVTAYLHLSRVTVAEGDTVEAGNPLGLVGATGRVTGPHLHWIARYGTVTLDPLTLEELSLERFDAPER